MSDIEELEGSRFLKQCLTCVFEGLGEGNYCFQRELPPDKKCKAYEPKFELREGLAIEALYRKFPKDE